MTDPEGSEGTTQPFTPEELSELKSQLETEKQARVAFEASLAALNGTIAEKDSRITELEQTLSARAAETNALKLASVAAYKALVARSNPGIPGELISGDTIEAINLSLESATTLIAKVRQSVEAEIASGKVPAGAPARTVPDLENLSPREKIQYGISKGGKN